MKRQNLELLEERICRKIDKIYGPADGIPVSTRQWEAVIKIKRGSKGAARAIEEGLLELAVEDLENALKGIEELLGEKVDFVVLDRIFSEFCIGK